MKSAPKSLGEEAGTYFHAHPVLLGLGQDFCRKYRSLGRFCGSVLRSNLSLRERQDLAAFLRREIPIAGKVSFAEFAAAWQETRFAPLPLEAFLLSLMPEGFSTKKEAQVREQQEKAAIMAKLQADYPHGRAARWLQALSTGELRLSPKELYRQATVLRQVAQGLGSLPEDAQGYERLPLFANRITGSPHGLDFDQPVGRLFLQALAFLAGEKTSTDADDITRLMSEFHILRDDILNFATVYGLAAYRDGREITYWREAAYSYSPLNIPLREIVAADKITPVTDNPQVIYIVENSGVFSALLDALQAEGKIVPLLALHGQLKAASWTLLDKLAGSGATFRYSGDLDPEGIGIAGRILARYAGASLWRMSMTEYRRANVNLPKERWKKLPAQVPSELAPLAQEMRKREKALYQESLIEDLLEDLWETKVTVQPTLSSGHSN